MVSVKAIDELLAVYILLVLRAAVPEMRVPVDHEDLFAVYGFKHGLPSLILFFARPHAVLPGRLIDAVSAGRHECLIRKQGHRSCRRTARRCCRRSSPS